MHWTAGLAIFLISTVITLAAPSPLTSQEEAWAAALKSRALDSRWALGPSTPRPCAALMMQPAGLGLSLSHLICSAIESKERGSGLSLALEVYMCIKTRNV